MPERLRALGLLEKYQISKLLTHCYGSVTLTAVLTHEPRSGDTQQFYISWLYPALSRLVQKHPLLSAVVQDGDKETAHFMAGPDFDLATIVSFDELAFWEASEQARRIAEQCDAEFDLNDHTVPLWRLHVDTHPDRPAECSITLAVQHVIADGKSLTIFWHDLLQYLPHSSIPSTSTASEHPQFVVRSNKDMAIQPAFEHRGGPRMGAMDTVRLLAGALLPSLFSDDRKDLWRGDRPSVMDRTKARHDTEVQVVRVEASIWKPVCATAKQHGVSPHAAIMTAILATFAELYPEQTAVKTATPVNCRAMCEPRVPDDEIGNFVGSYSRVWTSLGASVSQASFWDVAKAYHAGLQASKRDTAKDVFHAQFLSRYPDDFCDHWYKQWQRYPTMGRAGGIELSDLGRCAFDVQELYFCQTVNTFTLALNINTISTLDAMHATIAWQKGTLDERRVGAFGSTLLDKLRAAALA